MNRKKILVPVDIYEDSTELLHCAGSLATTIQARISCVNIMIDVDDIVEQDKNLPQQRRKVEMELSKIVNQNFKQVKPEFDIIVTRGDYTSRILQMTNDLSVDLMVVKAGDFDTLKPILSQLALAIIIVHNNTSTLKQLILPLNLDSSYYLKIQDSIDIAQLLNANLKVVSYTYSTTHEDKYKEKLYDIKNMIERENVACVTSFSKWNTELGSFLENLVSGVDDELPLLSLCELEELELMTNNSEFKLSCNTVIIPTKKKYLQKTSELKQLTYN